MNDEIKEILEDLKNKDLSVDDLTHNDKAKLIDCITNLEQKVEQYENPDDYTLFYMWLDAKAKDKMKQLQEENERLKEIEKFKFSIRKDETKIPPIVTKNYKREYEDYKSRCEKAIERLTLNGDIQEKDVIEIFANAIRDTRNILNGGDE